MNKSKKFNYLKFLIFLFFSVIVLFSFRIDLTYKFSLYMFFVFLIFIIIIWIAYFTKKKSLFSIIINNLLVLIFLNLILTPIFHKVTFDIPSRSPNYKIEKIYDSKFFEGMFYGKHVISSDEKGNRSSTFYKGKKLDEKISYEDKNRNTIRIFTIGASTTEGGSTDDYKTWSSLTGQKISLKTNKKVEVINTGMAGLRSKHHFYKFQRIQKYKPDLIIFLTGINDWNHHIVNEKKNYLLPWLEINFYFKNSIIFKTFNNFKKQLKRKFFRDNNLANKKNAPISAELDTEAYLIPQINSLEIRNFKRNFSTNLVSQDYAYWMEQIFKECNAQNFTCIFMDQPTAYQEKISEKLKKRLWMTPPNQDYTLTFDNLIKVSSLYNKWLSSKVSEKKLYFCPLSSKFKPETSYFIDDCHFTEGGSQKVSQILTSCIYSNFNLILN